MNQFIAQSPFLNPICGTYGQQPFPQMMPQMVQMMPQAMPQMPQPMMQQIAPPEQPQPAPQQPVGVAGKYVNDFSEIMAKDVPISSPAVFIKNDRSEIQLRQWENNGEINPITYKRVETPKSQEIDPNELLNAMAQRLEDLEEKMNKMQKPVVKAKKEGE